jgi:sialidase-1
LVYRVSWLEADAEGVILFANPAHEEVRSNMTVRLSSDGGQT